MFERKEMLARHLMVEVFELMMDDRLAMNNLMYTDALRKCRTKVNHF